jgi:hypothetical protein
MTFFYKTNPVEQFSNIVCHFNNIFQLKKYSIRTRQIILFSTHHHRIGQERQTTKVTAIWDNR